MDHTRHTRLTADELTETALKGAAIFGPGDERIGHVARVLGVGEDARVVIDVGGFLGIGSKPVAVAVRELDFMRDAGNSVHAVTRWTKDELKDMPAYLD